MDILNSTQQPATDQPDGHDCEVCGAPGLPVGPGGMVLCKGCTDTGAADLGVSETDLDYDKDPLFPNTESDDIPWNDTMHKFASDDASVVDEASEATKQASTKVADISSDHVKTALQELDSLIPAIVQSPGITPDEVNKVKIMKSRLNFALENYVDNEYTGVYGDYLEKLYHATLKLKQLVRSKMTIPPKALDEVDSNLEHIYTASVKHLMETLPTPEHLKSKKTAKLTQESFVEDKTKLLGKPGEDWDATNYFDNRELARKFYSQFFEDAVLVADDGSYYQVLEVLMMSGNFVCMLQDVLYPQIVFTISVTDLMAHIWKWVTPYDVVVNPNLAPAQIRSVSEIISVGDVKKPDVPDRWLSY